MLKSLWSLTRKTLGSGPVRRRKRMGPTRSVGAINALESRVLLAADLVLTGFSYDFLPSPTNPNGYVSHLEVTVKNAGTTTVDLAGSSFNIADNVVIDSAFSVDPTFGNIDDFPTGSVTATGQVTDNIAFPLAPNQEWSFLIVAEVSPMPGVS